MVSMRYYEGWEKHNPIKPGDPEPDDEEEEEGIPVHVIMIDEDDTEYWIEHWDPIPQPDEGECK